MIFNLRRKEARILDSAALADYLTRGGKTISGVNVTPEKAMTYAAVFASVRVLSESAGKLPLHVFTKSGTTRSPADGHWLSRLLGSDGPNKFQTAQEFVEWVVVCLALRGNAYSFKPEVRGEVRELLPIAPGAVTPRFLDDGWTPVYDVQEKGGKKTYPASEIVHFKGFGTDPLVGLSAVGLMRETIGFGMAAAEHGARLFANSANPSGVLSTDKPLSVQASKRLIGEVEELVGGLENAGRTLVLGDGMKWQQIGMSSEDAQWLESRKFTRSEIAGIFRVPPHLIADLDRATFSNIEELGRSFIDYSLDPYLVRIEQRIRKQVIPEQDRATHYAQFNRNAFARGNMQARAEFYTRQVQNGALSPNEIRALEDMNPREGGDIYLTPANMLIDGKAPPKEQPLDIGKQAGDTGVKP